MAQHNEQCIDSRSIFTGRVITVTEDTVRLENGGTSTREVVHHGGGAAVVALNDKGEIALVRQYRYAHGCEMVEIPAGKVEAGEGPFETARRELCEEAGCTATRFVPFGTVIPTPGYCTETIYLYLATGLTIGKEQNLDEDEFVTVFWLPLDEAYGMALKGEIADSKSVSGILRAKLLQDAGELEAYNG